MADQRPQGYIERRWEQPDQLAVAPIRIMDNLFYVGNKNVSCHLIATDEGHILIDTAFATTVPLLVDSIERLGFSLKDIRYMLHTHGHVDHAGGTARMKELTGAQICINRADTETVQKGTELTCAEYIYGITGFETFKVDRPLGDNDVIELGGSRVTVYHTPGHTPGVSSYAMTLRDGSEEHLAFLFGGPGQWTFRTENRSQGYEGDLEDYRRTLERLEAFDVSVPLGAHPGQNETFDKAEKRRASPPRNPFIDPEGWKDFLLRLRKSFTQFTAAHGGSA